MNASELRIGNYFNDPHGNISEVIRLNSTMINSHGEDECQPIPLSEEWLIKLGFIDDEPHHYINIDEYGAMSIQFNQYLKVISLFSAGAHYYLNQIKYVHQLQNLYFALTGEELTTNL